MAASFQLGKMSKLITVTRKGKIIIQHAQQGIKMRSLQQHVRISANLWGESAVFFGEACRLKKLIIIIWPLMGDIKESEDIMSFQPCWMRGWERQSGSLAHLTWAKWQTTTDQRWKVQRGQWYRYTFQSGGCSDRTENSFHKKAWNELHKSYTIWIKPIWMTWKTALNVYLSALNRDSHVGVWYVTPHLTTHTFSKCH